MMRMSPELMILCDVEISKVELVPPWKLCTEGQGRVQEDSLLILSVHHPLCEAPKGVSFENLLATEESHSPNATYTEVPALCLSWQDAMCVNRQILPFTTFWYFWRSKSVLHKLYKNLDLTQVSFLEEGGFHQPYYMRTDTSHNFSSFQTQCQALETLATKRCIFIVSISMKERRCLISSVSLMLWPQHPYGT